MLQLRKAAQILSTTSFPHPVRPLLSPAVKVRMPGLKAAEYPNEGSKLADVTSQSTQELSEVNPLLQPWKLGGFDLAHRLVYAPLTRCRAIDTIPQPAAAEYYSQRASGGLMINEATCVAVEAHGECHTCQPVLECQSRIWFA